MKIQHIHTLYFSPTGTTKKVVTAIASAFSADAQIYDITCDRDTKLPIFSETDLLIIGLPVYGGRLPELSEETLKRLQGNGTLCIPVVVYGNRAYEDALLELTELLSSNGFTAAAAGAFVGEHSFGRNIASGRPDSDDLAIAVDFGTQIRNTIAALQTHDDLLPLAIPGNHPYKERVPSPAVWCPETLDTCTSCGLCANLCPVQIIDHSAPSTVTAPEKCLHCSACVKGCPVNAKVMSAEPFKMAHGFLTANYTALQQQPELFL